MLQQVRRLLPSLPGVPFSLLKLNSRSSANGWGLNSSAYLQACHLDYSTGCTCTEHASSTNQQISRIGKESHLKGRNNHFVLPQDLTIILLSFSCSALSPKIVLAYQIDGQGTPLYKATSLWQMYGYYLSTVSVLSFTPL